MKTHWIISVFILTDRTGDWWETVKRDGTTRMFVPLTAQLNHDKEFKSADTAKRYAEKHFASRRYQVMRLDPPVRPSRTWEQTVEYATP